MKCYDNPRPIDRKTRRCLDVVKPLQQGDHCALPVACRSEALLLGFETADDENSGWLDDCRVCRVSPGAPRQH